MSRYLSALPLACFLGLVAYACYSTAVIGHWPFYGHPDPTDLPLHPLGVVVALASLLGLLSTLALPLVYAAARGVAAWRKRPLMLRPRTLPLYLAGATLWITDFALIHIHERWSLLSWIMD